MKKTLTFAAMLLALSACAMEPTWNEAVFPHEPVYGAEALGAAPTTDARK